MHQKIINYFVLAIAFLVTSGSIKAVSQQHQHNTQHQNPTSSYIEQLNSSVRGLSSQEIDNLVNGEGAGYARMAELNSYPGPRHVLDLRSQLNLSSQQNKEIQTVFEQMNSDAKSIGKMILVKEKQLSNAFASGKISNTELEQATNELGQLYGKLRKTHLKAHLRITPLLSPQQIQKYNELRGYKS